MTNLDLKVEEVRRRSRRVSLLVGAFVASVVILAVGFAVTLERVGHIGDQVTKIVQSPCQRDPAGLACANLRARVLKHEPLQVTCIAFTKVGLRAPACATFAKKHPGLTAPTEQATGASQSSVPSRQKKTPSNQDGANSPSPASGTAGAGTSPSPSGSSASPSGPQPGIGGAIDGLLNQLAPGLNQQLGQLLKPPTH